MDGVLLAACAFLLGSIPTGLLLARARGIDIRAVGSGNIGATNVGRALGRRWGAAVLVVDAAKGFLPVAAGRHLLPHLPAAAVAAAGLAAVAGHVFTPFLRGRGGKGVATSLGVALAVSPAAALGSLAVWAAVLAASRIVSVASLVGVASFPALAAVGDAHPAFVGLGVIVFTLVAARHRANIGRLLRGAEPRV